MSALPASAVATGAQLQQFVLHQLRQRGLTTPAAWPRGRSLADYLSALWHASQPYRDRPFQFYFVAELLEQAFDYPPMPYDWAAALRQPYAPTPDHLAPAQTPAYYAELSTYAYFERVIRRQIMQLKRLARQPRPAGFEEPLLLDGHPVTWANLFVEPFLERGTSGLEEATDEETDASWGYLAGILHDGQYME